MVKDPTRTREDDAPRAELLARARVPALVVVFADGQPALRVLPLETGRIAIGRDLLGDDKVSREHAEVRLDDGVWSIRDLGSKNGTFVDGERVGETRCASARVLRFGQTLCLPLADARALIDQVVYVRDGIVVGPTLAEAFARIDRAARTGEGLLVTGETGTGKEVAARLFHASGPNPKGPFVAVNCAAIPEGVAERLLFGARKGAFSGATDAHGHVQAADGGTLFLDEIAELDLAVQAKLLRVIESRTVTPLGVSRPIPVSMKVCVATHADLRAEVAAGRFREDLYFRVGRPHVQLPAVRERLEDVAWLVAGAVERAAPGVSVHARLVEGCLLRDWPGNVRELGAEVAEAAHAARASGREAVGPEDLPPQAGTRFSPEAGRARLPARTIDGVTSADVEDAVAREGSVSAAARALGLHRTQVRRLLKKTDG